MKTLKTIIFLIAVCSVCSCEKDFLDAKPDKALLVPSTLADLQALLDNSSAVFNQDPNIGQIASDDYYTTSAGMLGLPDKEQNSYLWSDDVYEGSAVNDWIMPYRQIFYANVVLEGAVDLEGKGSSVELDAIRGSALFYRAWALYQLSQHFTVPYVQAIAAASLGLPLHNSSDVNERPGRGTLQQTYDQILKDALEAEKLLPLTVRYKTRPTRAAAYGFLTRVYLSMRDYAKAEKYATACLTLERGLIDYNTLNLSSTKPFPVALPFDNVEILFYSHFITSNFINNSTLTIVDSTLYAAYQSNDLRKGLYFRDRGNKVITFKGSYSGSLPSNSTAVFSGLATDEILLTRAECLARRGDISAALADLNTLMEKRWKKGTFRAYSAGNKADALRLILIERRKELFSRGIRWTDLRRLNTEPGFETELKRNMDNTLYTLRPGDKKYTFPIPLDEVQMTGIEQNPR